MQEYSVIVIGGGHAGCEAALASANMGIKTALITSKIETIALAPCNPSIGGPAKGIVVREIDALGGAMGKISDKSMLQIKMLNRSKGPAVHSLRAQIDKIEYPKQMQKLISETENLTIIEDMVEEIIYNEDFTAAKAVKLMSGKLINTDKVIITTGTYMDSYIINGSNKVSSGPDNLPTTKTLSESIKKANIEMFRLKTGTPARVKVDSIDFSQAELTGGDDEALAFSFYEPTYLAIEDEVPCHLIYTRPETHKIINDNLGVSGMYSGVIEGVGPRYCPSIEDKIVRFADKERHQLFLEPESRHLDTIYVQGFSTSMPYDVQDKMIASLPGLENAVIDKYGYAIEYEAIKPEQLKVTLESKKVDNLYFAGQVNGTSGYEEAAGQGIVAGINAALSVQGKEPLVLSRMDSYIGLMIDDLITKGTEEPYRLLTSRSEFRLYLRSDNADLRLSEKGYQVGLLKPEHYQTFQNKQTQIDELTELLKTIKITPKQLTPEIARKYQTEELTRGMNAFELLKRPTITIETIQEMFPLDYPQAVLKQVEIQIKYAGYIAKVHKQMERQEKLYRAKIKADIDYNQVPNLALEAQEKLNKIKPETLGHAAQISGINPADISMLQIYLETKRKK